MLLLARIVDRNAVCCACLAYVLMKIIATSNLTTNANNGAIFLIGLIM